MQVSAEIRWYWCDVPPTGLDDWFCQAGAHPCPAGGGRERLDRYLRDSNQSELSLKLRGAKPGVEVKGLVSASWGDLAVEPFAGPVELWTKWTSESLDLAQAALVDVRKVRWLRKFDTGARPLQEIPLDADEKPADHQLSLPDLGCNVEFTRIQLVGGKVWWTFGFEAFGPPQTVQPTLQEVATILADRRPPALEAGLRASYPAWLAAIAGEV